MSNSDIRALSLRSPRASSRYSSVLILLRFSALVGNYVHGRTTRWKPGFRLVRGREISQDLGPHAHIAPIRSAVPSLPSRLRPKSSRASNHQLGPATAACNLFPETTQAEASFAGPRVLGRALLILATLEEAPCRRSPRDRGPVASRGVPPVLAIDFDARSWPSPYL